MKKIEFWIPIIVSILFTPISLILALFSAGMGHGDYVLAKILFPFTMLSTVFLESINDLFIVVAFVQFPIYGLIITVSGKRQFTVGVSLFAAHTLFILACFLFTFNGPFS